MKSEKGITLASLGIYIVVILIALITLATITAYFQSNVNEFNTKTTVDLEFDKFNLYFIEEVKKTNNQIDETNSNDTKILFSSGNTYEFKENSIILNGNIAIAEKIEACTFSFSKDENNIQSVTVYMKVGDTERTNQYTLSNQTADIQNDEDYIYGYKRVSGTNELILDNSIKTNLKDYKIYGNSVQDGTPTPETPVEIKSVGDKTINILKYPYADSTKESNGISWTDNGDGTITANGTATANSFFSLPSTWYDWDGLTEGETYYFSGCPEGGSTSTYFIGIQDSGFGRYSRDLGEGSSYTANKNPVYMFISIRSGTTVNNLTFKPMLSLNPIDDGYEPYGKYKIPIIIGKRNLFNFDKIQGQAQGTPNYDNKSIFLSSDNNLYVLGQSFTGTPTAFEKFNEVLNIDEAAYYCLKVKVTSDREDITTRANWGLNVAGDGAISPTVITHTYKDGYLFVKYQITEEILDSLKNNANTFRLYMYTFRIADTQENVDVTVSDFMFVKGNYTFDTMPEYETYVEPTTTNIFLDEPLRKIENYADYIDFENHKVVRKIYKTTVDPNLEFTLCADNWQRDGYTSWFTLDVSEQSLNRSENMGNILCNRFEGGRWAWNSMNAPYNFAGYHTKNFYVIVSNDFTGITVDDDLVTKQTKIKNWFSANNTEIYFPLETPTEELIELPTLSSYKGTTTIRIDTEIPPSNTEVVYYSK